jgi:hypothetical protein
LSFNERFFNQATKKRFISIAKIRPETFLVDYDRREAIKETIELKIDDCTSSINHKVEGIISKLGESIDSV